MIRVPDKTRTYVLEAILGLALVVAPGVAAGAAMDSAHGNIAEWIAAIATALAFVAAFFAAMYTKQAYEIEQAREDRALDAIEREQASKVAAWTVLKVMDGPKGEHPAKSQFHIRNASDVPVTGVSVRFYLHQFKVGQPTDVQDLGWERAPSLPPSPDPFEYELTMETRAKLIKAWDHDPQTERDLRIRLRFVDAAGTPWQRLPNGKLEKIGWDEMLNPGDQPSAPTDNAPEGADA